MAQNCLIKEHCLIKLITNNYILVNIKCPLTEVINKCMSILIMLLCQIFLFTINSVRINTIPCKFGFKYYNWDTYCIWIAHMSICEY